MELLFISVYHILSIMSFELLLAMSQALRDEDRDQAQPLRSFIPHGCKKSQAAAYYSYLRILFEACARQGRWMTVVIAEVMTSEKVGCGQCHGQAPNSESDFMAWCRSGFV